MNDFSMKVLSATLGKTHIFSVGQAGYIIKSASGQLLAIDLYLSECVERIEGNMGFKRLLPGILSPFELSFDVLITTHSHTDHFDIDSVPELMSNNQTKLYAAIDCKDLVQRLKMTEKNVTYVVPGESYESGDFIIHCINCDHGAGAPDAIGVVVEVDGKRVLEVGDSCLRLDRIEEYLSFGSIDVMIAPINGAYGNLNEEECAKLADMIQADMVIPCHYGMFASHGGNPGKFYRIMKEQYPKNEFILMTQGEKYTF